MASPLWINGGAGNDTLTGSDGADVLYGGAGDDRLIGGAGDDLLIGGAGDDWMFGGSGNDTYVVDSYGDGVFEAVDGGVDTALTYVSYTLQPAIENATSLSQFNVGLYGNSGDNILTGGPGNDSLIGAGGHNVLLGNAGIDFTSYSVVRAAASVTRADGGPLHIVAGDAVDTVWQVELIQFGDELYSFEFSPVGNLLATNFTIGAGGWSSQDLVPRHVADVNGDGYADIIGFSQNGVRVSWGSANGTFSDAALVLSDFGLTAGWSSDDRFHRVLADVNGDGRADIVGFGLAGTLVSLATASGSFDKPLFATEAFGAAQGWTSQDRFARAVGDINGDGKADLVGFGNAGTYVALGNGDGTFAATALALSDFGVRQGWTSDDSYHRTVADVDGDGKADIIGFGASGTYVALSNGDGTFSAPLLALGNFAAAQGWSSQDKYPRAVADVNGDGRADIVGFGQDETWVAFGQADLRDPVGQEGATPIGLFSRAAIDVADFAVAQGWTSDNSFHRELADINNDGTLDIVGFGYFGVLAGLGQGDLLL